MDHSVERMKIALMSPKGPLYRHRGGIFRKSLRYQPLTLTTLAALVPPELNADVAVYDEGIEDVPEKLEADLIGITVITGTAKRAYELADHFRSHGRTVVLGGPHVTLLPAEATHHADAIVIGYAEDAWPQLLRDFAAGALKREYSQAPDFSLDRPDMPFARRELFDRPLPDPGRVRGHTILRARLRVLRGAQRLGPQAVPEAGVLGDRGHPPRRRQAHPVHRPEPGVRPRLRTGTVHRAHPAQAALVRAIHRADRARPRADAAHRPLRLPRLAARPRDTEPRRSAGRA